MRELREELGLSRSAFGRRLGFSPSYVGLVERGLRSPSELFRRRVETLSKDSATGVIGADDWLDADVFQLPDSDDHKDKVPKSTGTGEARR